MKKQVSAAGQKSLERTIALVTDSTCDLPADLLQKYDINVVPISILIGNRSYQDGIELQSDDFYRLLRDSREHMSTSQPPVTRFSEVYRKLSTRYRSILSLHLSANLSGTINGARLAAREFDKQVSIDVVDTRTTSIGLGLVAAEAGKLVDQGLDIGEIVQRLKSVIDSMAVFVSIPTLKYLIRSGRLNRAKGFLGTVLNLKPVISLNAEGRVVEAAKVIGRRNVVKKTLELAVRFAERVKNPRFCVAHVLNPELAGWYRSEIFSRCGVSDVLLTEASPALGVHTGIGSAGIAVLGDPL
jgi:DegV family protein with EDD domain